MKKPITFVLVALLLVFASARISAAAGFEVVEQGGRALGNAYAGKAASGEDATTVAFNPAGMLMIDNLQSVFALHGVFAQGRLNDRGSTSASGGPAVGSRGGNPGAGVIIPTFFAVLPVCERVRVGFGNYSTFGLATEYGAKWMGRYLAIETDLETYNITGSVAVRILDNLSVGVGIDWQRAVAKMSNAVDYGSIAWGVLGPQTASAMGLFPEGSDGRATLESRASRSWGWNIGLLFELSEKTRIGIAYRSQVHHSLAGRAKFQVPPEAMVLTGSGLFTNGPGGTRITIPDQCALSAYHEINDQWTILADITWTNWSVFDELKIRFGNGIQPDSTTTENWKDAFRYSIGVTMRPCDKWTFRAGLAYDESPIPSMRRTPRIPTNTRIWMAVGAGYQVTESIAVDIAWMHVLIKDAPMRDTAATGQQHIGKMESRADVIAIQFTMDL